MKIAIVSPSAPSTFSPTATKQFKAGLTALEAMGFECALMPHAKDTWGYSAASTTDRLSDLHAAYADPTIDIIMAANGGWSCTQLLEGLNYELIKKNPKPLAGASDITALQNTIYKKTGNPQLYSPMVTWGLHNNDPQTLQSFRALTTHGHQEWPIDTSGTWLKPGTFDAVAVGGNLVSVSMLLGTPYEPDWHGKVFIWEDTQESIYRLDRALTHFKNAGVWDKIAGMMIGHLDQIDETFGGRKFDTMAMITDHFVGYNFPILKTELFGHNISTQITLPIGGRIIANHKKVLTTLQP